MDFEHNPFFKRFTHFNLTMNGVYEHFYLFNFEISFLESKISLKS